MASSYFRDSITAPWALFFLQGPNFSHPTQGADTRERHKTMSEGSVFMRGDGRVCAVYKDAKGKTHYLYAKTKPETRRRGSGKPSRTATTGLPPCLK